MKRKIARNIFLFFTVLILLGISSFASLKLYYQERFKLQTWVNDIYLTGQTVETANEMSREISKGTKEYADSVLAGIEVALQDAMKVIQNNRKELK